VRDNVWTAAIIAAGILLAQLAITQTRRRRNPNGVGTATSPPSVPGRSRPLGVTILAALYYVSSAWSLLVLILAKLATTVLRGVLQLTMGTPPVSGGILAGTLAFARLPLIMLGALAAMSLIAGRSVVVTASFLASLGYGMWRGQNWARIVTIVLVGWMLARMLFTRLSLEVNAQTTTWLLSVAACVSLLCYLFTPTVRTAFRSTSSAATSPNAQTA
jgi:hypothetical protein